MYPRVFPMHAGDLRPILTGHPLVEQSEIVFNLTGMVTCRFFMLNLHTDLLQINGVAGVVDIIASTLSYTWILGDTNTAGHYATWFLGYYGPISTVPQTFEGPEVLITAHGKRLVY
jgi:hypothetical protein